jgi:hypothetical protein
MKKAIALLVLGIILALGPIWGALCSTIATMSAFTARSEIAGKARDAALASHVSFATYTVAVGIIMFPIGFVLMVTAIIWISLVSKDGFAKDASLAFSSRILTRSPTLHSFAVWILGKFGIANIEQEPIPSPSESGKA